MFGYRGKETKRVSKSKREINGEREGGREGWMLREGKR